MTIRRYYQENPIKSTLYYLPDTENTLEMEFINVTENKRLEFKPKNQLM
jgi:hypothetical protein